jgi:hypothetical protein
VRRPAISFRLILGVRSCANIHDPSSPMLFTADLAFPNGEQLIPVTDFPTTAGGFSVSSEVCQPFSLPSREAVWVSRCRTRSRLARRRRWQSPRRTLTATKSVARSCASLSNSSSSTANLWRPAVSSASSCSQSKCALTLLHLNVRWAGPQQRRPAGCALSARGVCQGQRRGIQGPLAVLAGSMSILFMVQWRRMIPGLPGRHDGHATVQLVH